MTVPWLASLLSVLLTLAAVYAPPEAAFAEGTRRIHPSERDSLLLVNRTGEALVYLVFHPMMMRPLPQQVEVDLSNPPTRFVRPDSNAALWPCDLLADYEGYTLHLYRVPDDVQGVVQAHLARSLTMTTTRLNAAQRRDCRLVIEEL